MREEDIVFDQSIDGVFNCMVYLLMTQKENKLQVIQGVLEKMNNSIFQSEEEIFTFYKQFLIRTLEKENQKLSTNDCDENKRKMLDNFKIIRELNAIER